MSYNTYRHKKLRKGRHNKNMNFITLLRAKIYSYHLHKGQRDNCNKPYFLHPLEVSHRVTSLEAKCTALLHDTLEDCSDKTSYVKILRKFGTSVANAVHTLTRQEDEPYFDYISRIKKVGGIALEVKVADISHNLEIGRYLKAGRNIDTNCIQHTQKYAKALEILKGDNL